MNTYQYELNNEIRSNFIKIFKLNKPILIGLFVALGMTGLVFIIITILISSRQASFALFVLAGSSISLLFALFKRQKTIKTVLKGNQVKWDETQLIFSSGDEVLKEWNRVDTKVLEKNDNALYLVHQKPKTQLDYMAVTMPSNNAQDFVDLVNSFESKIV